MSPLAKPGQVGVRRVDLGIRRWDAFNRNSVGNNTRKKMAFSLLEETTTKRTRKWLAGSLRRRLPMATENIVLLACAGALVTLHYFRDWYTAPAPRDRQSRRPQDLRTDREVAPAMAHPHGKEGVGEPRG